MVTFLMIILCIAAFVFLFVVMLVGFSFNQTREFVDTYRMDVRRGLVMVADKKHEPQTEIDDFTFVGLPPAAMPMRVKRLLPERYVLVLGFSQPTGNVPMVVDKATFEEIAAGDVVRVKYVIGRYSKNVYPLEVTRP